MTRQTIDSGKAPLVWSNIDDAFTKINANFTELYASIGETGSIGFDALEVSLIPKDNDTYSLGTSTKRWQNLFLSGTFSLGGAQITAEGLTIDLPSGTTVGGQLIIDPTKPIFSEFSVNSDTSVVADSFRDVLDFQSGTGISLSVNSSADAIIFTNAGVTNITAGAGMSVSAGTGSVTITNTGVRTITGGDGFEITDSSASGDLIINNTGVIRLQAGADITLSNGGLPDGDGKIIITNSAPAGNAYRTIAVSGEASLVAGSTAATLTLIEGSGMNITTAVSSGALTNRITFENTGVLSLTAGAGITLSASTGAVTVGFNNRSDIIGSIFADDSTMLVDGTGAQIVGNINTSSLKTSQSAISLGGGAGLTSQGILAVAVGLNAGNSSQGSYALAFGNGAGETSQGSRAIAIGRTSGSSTQGVGAIAIGEYAGQTSQGANAIAIGAYSGQTNQTAGSIIINATGYVVNGAAAAFYVDPVRSGSSTGNILNYNTSTKEIFYSSTYDGDITGSVFGDDSTKLVDGVESKIVGPVDSATVTASLYLKTAVYADSTAISAAIPVAVKGMIVYDDGTSQFKGFNGSTWVALN